MGTGGARYGAGRPGWRRKCDYMLRLDVRDLERRGHLKAEKLFGWRWTRGDEQVANITVRTFEDAVLLSYTWTPYAREPLPIRCRVALSQTPCNFGGSRRWFVCPDCDRRCAVLFGISRRGNFACRTCQRLAYAC